MNAALWELMARQIRGRVVRWLRLLRQPKYLVGMLFGVAWMGWWLSRVTLGGNGKIHFAGDGLLNLVTDDLVAAVAGAASVVLALILTIAWALPWGGTSLRLSEAEAHLLLPSPLGRRSVIHYALLRSQPGILVGAIFMTIFLGAGPMPARLIFYLIFWMLLSLWDMHMKGRSLWWGRIRELPANQAQRRVAALAVILVAFWLSTLTGIANVVRDTGLLEAPAPNLEALLLEISTAWSAHMGGGWRGVLLLPFNLVLAPLFAGSPVTRLAALAVPALLLVAQHEWVVRFRTRFEEEAVAREREEREKRRPGGRIKRLPERARRSAPFRLAPLGRPEVAVLWKNLTTTRRTPLLRQVALFAAALLLLLIIPLPFRHEASHRILGAVGLLAVPYCSVFSPFWLRHDFRADLLHAETLRAWPLRGGVLAFVEILGPTLSAGLYTAVALGLFVVSDLGLRLGGFGGFLPVEWARTLGVADILLPVLAAASAWPVLVAVTWVATAVLNLATLLFPSWMQLGARRHNGAANMGQRLLMFWGTSICLAVGLLPAALILGGVFLVHGLTGWSFSAWELPLLGLLAALPLLLEGAGLALACGGRWDRLDPTGEILSGDSA